VQDREFHYTRQDFEQLRQLVAEYTGINLSEHKQEMLYSRLSRRLRALNLDSFASYYEYLRQHGGEELIPFVNAMTTNLTAFFRESHHFEILATDILPQLMARKQHSRRIRIWSAGCATGEEAYCIAMIVKEVVPVGWDVKILATDLDSNVVAKAQRGVYEVAKLEQLSPTRRQRWFRQDRQLGSSQMQISTDLQALITFKTLNLIHSWPMRGPLDVIFCRNVVIYFSKETQQTLFDRFANLLDDEGYLLIGHSESLFQLSQRFHLLRQTIYQKRY